MLVIQISDCHLAEDPQFEKHGVNTEQAFQKVLESIYAMKPALIIASGDIAELPSEKAYQKFFKKLEAFHCPILAIAGNHDNKALLSTAHAPSAGSGRAGICIEIGAWQFIGLSTDGPTKHLYGGCLLQEELEFLEAKLKHSSRSTIVVLHHPPLVPSNNWLEEAKLENADEFIKLIEGYPQVKAVLSGHVHFGFEIEQAGIAYLSCPSTYRQFDGRTEGFAIDKSLIYGYREIELDEAGIVFSKIEYIKEAL